MPAASARSISARAVSSSQLALCIIERSSTSPKVMAPRQSVDTLTPAAPRLRISMRRKITRTMNFVAPCARGLEEIVAQELRALGADAVEPGRMHVRFAGELELAYRACLW